MSQDGEPLVLHGMHRVPGAVEVNIDPNYLILSAKYMRKSFMAFDEFAKINPHVESSYNWVRDSLYSGSEMESDD